MQGEALFLRRYRHAAGRAGKDGASPSRQDTPGPATGRRAAKSPPPSVQSIGQNRPASGLAREEASRRRPKAGGRTPHAARWRGTAPAAALATSRAGNRPGGCDPPGSRSTATGSPPSVVSRRADDACNACVHHPSREVCGWVADPRTPAPEIPSVPHATRLTTPEIEPCTAQPTRRRSTSGVGP